MTLCGNYYLLIVPWRYNTKLYDNTQFNPSHILRCTPQDNLRITSTIPKKHFPNGKKLVTNILKLKCHSHVTSDHGKMVYLGRSEFTDQDMYAKIRTMAYLGI